MISIADRILGTVDPASRISACADEVNYGRGGHSDYDRGRKVFSYAFADGSGLVLRGSGVEVSL